MLAIPHSMDLNKIIICYIVWPLFFFLSFKKIVASIIERPVLFLFYDGKIANDIVIATAYFPLNKSKHSSGQYLNWIRNFLHTVNCKTIIFTSPQFYEKFYENEIPKLPTFRRNLLNFNLTFTDVYDIPKMKSLKEPYQKMNAIDKEIKRHNHYLYAIWNSKIVLLKEATILYPNASLYFWVDSGCVRETSYLHFPSASFSQTIQNKYSNPPLEFCFYFINHHIFKKHSSYITFEPDVAEGTSFFGTKQGISKFDKYFWDVHDYFMKKNIFCGKDQVLYNYVFANFFDKINFYIFPAYRKFGWFGFISAFSAENPKHFSDQLLPSSLFLE